MNLISSSAMAADNSPRSQLSSPQVQSLKAESSPGGIILSPRSPLSPMSPRRESSENESVQQMMGSGSGEEKEGSATEAATMVEESIVEAGDPKEDAAFCAEAAAFAMKDDAHERAMQRLVADLVADGSEAVTKSLEGNAGIEVPADAAVEVPEVPNSVREVPQAFMSITDVPEEPTSVTEVPAPIEPQISAQINDPLSSDKKRQVPATKFKDLIDGKRHSFPLDSKTKRPSTLVVKPDRASPNSDGKRRVHPVKDKEKASPSTFRNLPTSPSPRTSPLSPIKPLKIAPQSFSDKMPSKPASRFMDSGKLSPKSTVSSCKNLDPNPEKPVESENVQRKMKEFFQRRKSAIGFGGRKSNKDNESVVSSELNGLLNRENPDLGPFLLKLAKQAVASGDNPQKALDFATRAAKSFEIAADGKPSLDLVMSLHILAAIHCTLGQFEEAIPVLRQSLTVPDIEGGGEEHALAAFAGHMQLGDTLALLGKGEEALSAYHDGLEVQKRALGEKDPRVRETCRYVAEAHSQALQFDKAQELCQHALDIHKEQSPPASIEEATDRRLMGLILNGKGQHEAALEHLVLASMALIANGKDVEVAAVDTSIGDTYVALGRYDEAVFAYQKALTVFKASKGENHVTVPSVYVSLAELYLKTGKLREARTYCESALRIFNKQGVGDEVASGLTGIAVVYEALNEQEQALSLLQKALPILQTAPGQQSAVAGVEAQIGVLNFMHGNYTEALTFFRSAVSKLRASAEKTSPLLGIVLNQMGLSCVHLSEIKAAAEFFEESRTILEAVCGPEHPDTLAVYSNLAGAYDALGRLDDAINTLQYVVEVREEKLGTASPEVEDERKRLTELLNEAGRLRARRLNNTLELLMQSNREPAVMPITAQNAVAH